LRRVGPVRAKPGNRFAPRGDNCPHPFGKWIAGIGTQEIVIPLHGVAFERCGIGILHTDIAVRLVANRDTGVQDVYAAPLERDPMQR